MRNIVKINLILIIAFLSQFNISAQDFKWKSEVNTVTENSYHRININPSVISKMENGLDDIRVYDSRQTEIPYIFEKEQLVNKQDYFIEYEILSKEHQNNWPYYTRLIIHNPSKENISNFQLIIKNSDVTKSLKLSGSDDKKNWYIVKDNYRFQAVYSDDYTSEIEIMNFPKSNYKYFEILIDDWKNYPINILKAGYFDTSYEEGKFNEIKKPKVSQEELKKEKESLLKIEYDYNQLIDKMIIEVKSDDFYLRRAEIQIKDSIQYKKKKPEVFFRTVKEITLSSNSSNKFYFDGFNTKEFYIRIHNKDNKPLKISSVKALQLNNYLICKLEKRGSYSLKFGDEKIQKAEYDLQYFKQDIIENIPTIECSEAIRIKDEVKEPETGLKISQSYIWIAIFLVISFLGYMTFKMLKDMKKEE